MLLFLLALADSNASRLLLVRHGETNFNADGRLQGRLESELTENGHAQAAKLGEWIAKEEAEKITAVFVSPKKRTRDTLSEIISKNPNLPEAEVRDDLREIELTVWEGQYKADIASGPDAERWAQWKEHPDGFQFSEDGHSPLGDLTDRAREEWSELVFATPKGSTSLVVAHGAFNRVFLLTALGLPVDDFGFRDEAKWFEFQNCACVELKWQPGAGHATAWRMRYPYESVWQTREQELARRDKALPHRSERGNRMHDHKIFGKKDEL
jgi:broad specificity phosphatase PhoE